MWLKSLRLHKYLPIFLDITYEEMLGLTDDYLEQKVVTKGARNKIILSIQKIKERKNTLLVLEKVIETVFRSVLLPLSETVESIFNILLSGNKHLRFHILF